ncbi:hypothetical protein GGR53DRAFT_525119 [Hypoxylon sp. FL1150]|nr:hypothetical protein GGR53DRAFT_525119 [Hypoxylon sp. FL1150]
MATPSLNYFTCTLGQAVYLKEQNGGVQNAFETVLALIEEQAKHLPDRPAVGFADFTSKSLRPAQVTFSELYNLSKHAAVCVADILHHPTGRSESPTIGLLCTSSLDFILTWLGLMRIGCKAFLLAPQLDLKSIQHLCSISGIETILVDGLQKRKDLQLLESVDVVEIPSYQGSFNVTRNGYDKITTEASDIAYIRHTSGTSSGLPKQIVQTQWGATGCLPSFTYAGQPTATFSTTPLYHGGLADCFRAWTSSAMIWFFPEGAVPITGNNIIRSVAYARKQSSVPVNYFSSVPYVLQLLADEHEGVRILQSMDLVGVGGAALAPSIGDKLVELGVNLVSRMGSSECGFLMSSHRIYAKDKEWQYLRPIVDSRFLSFEPRGDGLSELVVKPGWPLISKTNRDDGSYATADLFEPHPSIPTAWRYHSRADAQITLANGKKFDPSPLEEAINAATRLVRDVLIFGAGEDYPGALLFKAANTISDHEVMDSVWPEIEKLNTGTSSHARLTRSMLIVIGSKEGEEPLAKSSKGTILRRQAEARYARVIREAYTGNVAPPGSAQDASDSDLHSTLLKSFNHVLGHDIDPDQDFFQQGVDSIACIQARKLIESSILSDGSLKLPVNIIYDSGNVNSLAENLIRMRKGGGISSPSDGASLMSKFISKYSNFPKFVPGDQRSDGEVVLLTGTTGSLGAHILSQVAVSPQVKSVYCLVRASTTEEAQSRVVSSLKSRRIFNPAVAAKIVCLPSDFSQVSLGLDALTFEKLRSTLTTVIHSAWMVNFNVNLSSFEKSHIAGVHNLIKLCLSVPFRAPASFFFISSISAASGTPAPATIDEVHIEDLHHAPGTGYGKSKLVTEHIVRAAAKSAGMCARVLRTGQLIGDVVNGLWNPTEAIPLMVRSATTIGALPILDETPSWLPVDKCASAVLELSGFDPQVEVSEGCEEVYHLLNPTTFSWSNDLLPALRTAGLEFDVVTPREWISRLREGEQDPEKNPTVKLKGFDIIHSGILQKCLGNWGLEWTKWTKQQR